MIKYDGVTLENVANVMIEDIRVSPIALGVTARQRPIQFGSDFVRVTGGSRTVAITFAVLDNTPSTREATLQAVTNWARKDHECKLVLDNPSDKYLMCICTQLPEPSTRQWWESKLRLVFTCYDDPYWNSNTRASVNCGTQFSPTGNAPPLMEITRTLSSAATDQSYSDGTNTMKFTTIPAGDLVIDLNKQTATVDGVSIMQYYTFDSKFIIPKKGVQTITGTGKIYFRARYQ